MLPLVLITVKCGWGEPAVHYHFRRLQTGGLIEGDSSRADCILLHTPLLPPVYAGKQLDAAAGLLHGDLRIKVLELLYDCGTRWSTLTKAHLHSLYTK